MPRLDRDPPEECKTIEAEAEIYAYVKAIQERVLERWETPRDRAGMEYVRVLLLLREDGSIADLRVAEATNKRVARECVDAVQEAAPFGAMGKAARCLTDFWFTANFKLVTEEKRLPK